MDLQKRLIKESSFRVYILSTITVFFLPTIGLSICDYWSFIKEVKKQIKLTYPRASKILTIQYKQLNQKPNKQPTGNRPLAQKAAKHQCPGQTWNLSQTLHGLNFGQCILPHKHHDLCHFSCQEQCNSQSNNLFFSLFFNLDLLLFG